jgi:chemotaxis protein methyltransferase CheR
MNDPRIRCTTPSLEMSEASVAQFCQLIVDTLGIKMNASKVPMLQGRLQRRLRDLAIDSLEQYREHLFGADGASELQHFIDAVTTNKTDFFREPQHFDLLTRKVLPELMPRGAGGRQCKVWSAPCSSGEEPYTLAMVLAEYASRNAGFDFAVLATDISSRVLAHAARGVYDEERIAPVPEALRARYLLRARDPRRSEVRIAPTLRAKVAFHQLNFMQSHYGVRDVFDVIFCRNVLIYFDKPTQQTVVRRLARHLRPNGALFVGHSESLTGLDVPFTPCGIAVYRHSGGDA